MEQGVNIYENVDPPVPWSDIQFVLVTHSHIDHVGMLPYIYARGFKGRVIATNATCDLCNIMLKGFRAHPGDGRGMEKQESKACRTTGSTAVIRDERRAGRTGAF